MYKECGAEYHFHSDHLRAQSSLSFFKLPSCIRKTRQVAFKVQIICLDDGGSDLSPTDAFLQNHGMLTLGLEET